jgi:hypothetical protein
MGRTVRTLISAVALAVVYACVPPLPGEGGDGGSTSSSGGTSSGGSAVVEGGSADAGDDAVADAGPDIAVDAAADGGSCPVKCVTNALLPNGQPAPPNGGSMEFCKGGCTWSTPGIATSDYHNVCHMTCGGVCAPDPPYWRRDPGPPG